MLFKIPVTDGHKKSQINAKFHKETFDFNFEQRFENIPFVSFFQYIYSVKNITSRNKSLFYKVTEKTKIQVSNKKLENAIQIRQIIFTFTELQQ